MLFQLDICSLEDWNKNLLGSQLISESSLQDQSYIPKKNCFKLSMLEVVN